VLVKIGQYNVTKYSEPVFIFEVGINHNGSLQMALDMIDAAQESGADIVKFQYHRPSYEMLPEHSWQSLMTHCYLSISDLDQIKIYTEEQTDMLFLCTPFCREAATELREIGVEAFKTGSGEFNNIPFMRHVAGFGLPMIVSTGMTSRDELIATLDVIQKINPNNIILMNCTSIYPATFEQSRLRRLEWLRSMSNLPVGQSDHTPTIATALGAIAQGAVVVEKHVTLDKSMDGPDHAASILPSEFKQMVIMGKQIWRGMQDGTEANMGVLMDEWDVRKIANHSVVTLKDIKKGERFSYENLGVKRPGDGIPASKLDGIVGEVAEEELTEDTQLDYIDIRHEEHKKKPTYTILSDILYQGDDLDEPLGNSLC